MAWSRRAVTTRLNQRIEIHVAPHLGRQAYGISEAIHFHCLTDPEVRAREIHGKERVWSPRGTAPILIGRSQAANSARRLILELVERERHERTPVPALGARERALLRAKASTQNVRQSLLGAFKC